MAKNIFLIYNIGNSGGTWIMDICNLHPEVKAWPSSIEEINDILGILKGQEREDVFYDFIKNQYLTNPITTVGLVKSIQQPIIDFCELHNGRIVRTLRNPIGVVATKMGRKIKSPDVATPEEIFEAHVKFYEGYYKKFMDKRNKWPVYRLESLNESLSTDGLFFKQCFEYFTKVEWTEELIGKVRFLYEKCPECKGTGISDKLMFCKVCLGIGKVISGNGAIVCPKCKGAKCYKQGKSNCIRCGGKELKPNVSAGECWKIWPAKYQNIFRNYFDEIMVELGYKYPNG